MDDQAIRNLVIDLGKLFVALLVKLGDLMLHVIKRTVLSIDIVSAKVANWMYRSKKSYAKKRLIPAALSAPFRSLAALIAQRKRKKALLSLLKNKRKRKKAIAIFPLPFFVKFRYFLAGGAFSLLFIFLPILFFIFLQDLPSPRSITLANASQTTKIYDRNHTLLYQIYAQQDRTIIPLSAIPEHLKNATISIEDKDFYKHPGFDISAIIRSAYENLSGNGLQGGSTITQQLIKSTLLTPEISIVRKVKEIILAFWTERLYSKDEILELYFNLIPYGGTAWGVEAASQTYFGKRAKDLNLSESAFLAGIPKAPTIYSPYGNATNLWKKRQREVLARMVSLGYISKVEAKEAEKAKLAFQPPRSAIHAPHFVMYVKDVLAKRYGLAMVEKGGLSVVTSLDLKLQETAQKIVSSEVQSNTYLHLTNGAALITNPRNGDILAMVGSKDFNEEESGNVNVTASLRQPGSSIKVVTYSQALLQGFTAASILDDSPVTYAFKGAPSYSPVNYDGKFHGRVPLRLALGNSFNVPAVKTLNQIGIEKMVSLGKKMGITSWKDASEYGLSITLGGADVTMLEMATVYGVLANNGNRVDLNPILKITDYKGNVVEEKNHVPKKRVLDSGIAFIISDILADNNARSWAFGPSSPLVIPGKTVSVKTGTSDNKRDNWTIGYTPSYIVAVWVGNNDNSPMSQAFASGISGAAPIWHKIMQHLLRDKPDERLPMPGNIAQRPCFGRTEYFIQGTEHTVFCTQFPSGSPTPQEERRRRRH